MGDENHIILHLFTLNNRYFVRIVSVDHTDDYKSEVNGAYPDLQVCNIVPLYNSAEWTSRLFNDIKYKRFKGVTIEPFQGKQSLWEVKGVNQEEWFANDFEPYIRLKLLEYEEDNYDGDSNNDVVKDILSAMNSIQPSKYIEISSSNVTCKADTFKLKNPERTDDGEVILTKNQRLAMLLTCITYNESGLKIDGASEYPHDILLRQCEDSENIYLSSDTFTIKEIPYIMDAMGINYITIIQITTSSEFRNFIQANFGKGINEHNLVSSNLGFEYLEDQSLNTLDDYFESFYYNVDPEKMKIDFQSTEQDIVRKVPKAKKETSEPEPKEQCFLCVNNITLKLEKYAHQYRYLTEISFLCDVDVKTKLGESLFDKLLTIKKNDVEDIVQDITKFLDVIKTVFQSNRACNDKGDVLNTQRYHTCNYVEKYKDDNAEVMASAAIEKVFMFLSKYISGKDINMNQIGKDLVDLGVKKTRKTRGNVYGLANPSKSDLDKFVKTASAAPTSPITNLPPFTGELVIPLADSWDTNPSRIGCGKSSEKPQILSSAELLLPTTDERPFFARGPSPKELSLFNS